MALITIPAVPASGFNMQLMRGDIPLEFLAGGEVIVQSTKAVFACDFPLKPLKEADARLWRSVLVQLSKLGNTFKLQPPPYIGSVTGYSGPQPLVKGTGQLGLSLICDIVSTPSTLVAREGEWLEVSNGEFKCLTSDATTAAGGSPNEVTFNFEPALRNAPTDNTACDIITPQLTLRMLSPHVSWANSLGDFHGITIQAIEAFGP